MRESPPHQFSAPSVQNFSANNPAYWPLEARIAMNGPIYLEKGLRNKLFSRAYNASGGSLRKIADTLGYTGKGRNGPIRDMWLMKIAHDLL